MKLYTWGLGNNGQLGTDKKKLTTVRQGQFHMLPNKVGTKESGSQITGISTYGYHSMYVTSSGSVYGFGGNNKGRMGLDGEEVEYPT